MKLLIFLMLISSSYCLTIMDEMYNNYILISVKVDDVAKLDPIKKIEGVELWNHVSPVLISIENKSIDEVKKYLNENNIPFEIKIDNLNDLVRRTYQKNPNLRTDTKPGDNYTESIYFSNFHNYDEVIKYLNFLQSQNPDVMKISSIGKSFEGRDILAVTLTKNKPKIIMLECGIHSREWASQATCQFVINKIINSNLLDHYSFDIIPVANPDGYVYTWEKDRFWRKTRSNYTGEECRGADANRNFDANWCSFGSSKNPCEEDFCGKSVFSEPEAKALADHMKKLSNKGLFKAYFSVHAFSQLWMMPYGASFKVSSNKRQMDKLSEIAAKKIYARSGLTYTTGPISVVLYKSSGSSIDYVHDKHNVKVAFAIELRDKGEYGFLMPPEEILPTANEFWDALEGVLTYLINY